MRILIVHNRYQQRGGEDVVVAAEANLLREHGHAVELLEVNNDHIQGLLVQVTTAIRSVYSFDARRLLRTTIQGFLPDVVHIHNVFPTLSPAVFQECAKSGVPVVHTLHNFRIQCAAATLFRDGKVCEECVTAESFWPGVEHACYRSSRVGSAVSGFGMAFHAYLGTWRDDISAYIALNAFSADKLGRFRIPREKIHVKPNSVPDQGIGQGGGNYAIFVGRLSPEKGLSTLIDADRAGTLCMDVLVVGDGPMRPELEATAARPGSRIKLRGFMEREQVVQLLKGASAFLFTSLWYEAGLPLVVIEALSVGLPLVAADIGSTAVTIREQGVGLVYAREDQGGLSKSLRMIAEDAQGAQQMRRKARSYYLETHTPEINYERLVEIYTGALARHSYA